jgi:hypothetical protein
MTDYSWDLGFDFATAQGSNGNYSLQMGFQANGSPVDPINGGVTTNNSLFFNLFNIGPSGDYSFSDAVITFTSTGEDKSPFDPTQSIPLGKTNSSTTITTSGNTSTIIVGSNVGPQATGPSAIFFPGNALQAWSVLPAAPMSLVGTFQVTVSITVQRSDGVTKTFFHDPEMVVGSGT